MADSEKYIFGPVPSRRLGLSLGVDIVPHKACTLDCIYCQVGRTTQKTIERKEYVPIEAVLAEIKNRIKKGLSADYITISGSGEPTLNSRLGELVDGIKKITKTPVAILTNGTLLYRPDVRADCAGADVVLPSLDAGDEQTFLKINRPHPDINIKKLIQGLIEFRKEYSGRIWLEVFLVQDVNTDDEQIASIRDVIEKICPDKVQLNTAVRPTAENGVRKVEIDDLNRIAQALGPKAEVIADFSEVGRGGVDKSGAEKTSGSFEEGAKTLLSMLKRRPCSVEDIVSSLNLKRAEVLKYISILEKEGKIYSTRKGEKEFFSSR
jgi:wyosine [tRNA(Phe)-imidazoG37] synthetase (radical SAM superfamily)